MTCFSAHLLPAPPCPSSPALGAAGSLPALTAHLLLHTQCWQQLHPCTHGQGFKAAAFAIRKHRARGAVKGWKVIIISPSLQSAFLTAMKHCIELFIEISMIKPKSHSKVVRFPVDTLPTQMNLGRIFPSFYVTLRLPTPSFTFCFPASSLGAARSFCNSLPAALVLDTPNDSVSSAKVYENES